MIYKTSCLRPVSSNPVLRLEHQNSYSESYKVDMKILSLDMESLLKTGPDDI
jgi:hypothetical protein